MPTSPRQAKFALSLLFLINFMNMYDRQIIGAIGERIKAEWMLSDSQLAGLSTAFILLYAVIGIPLGRLSDIGSRKHILAAGVTVWSAFTALSGIASSFTQMIAFRLGVGVGEASAAPAASSLIGDLFPLSQRSRAISVFMLGVPVGLGASSLISGFVVQATDSWRATLFIAAIPGFILGALALRLPEPARGAADPDVETRRRSTLESLTAILKVPTMWWIIASGALFNLNAYTMGAFLASYLIRFHGLNIGIANRYTAVIFGIGGTIGMLGGGWIGDVMVRRAVGARLFTGAAACLLAVPLFLFALHQPRGAPVLFTLAMSVAVGLGYVYYATTYATIQDVVDPQLRGMAMSTYFFVFYMFTAIGLVGLGKLSDIRIAAALAAGASAADSRALGLHDALYALPVIYVLVAFVLVMGSRTAKRDYERVRATA